MIKFVADGQQPGTIFPSADDAIATQFASKDFDLGPQESNAGIAANHDGSDKEMTKNKELAQHDE